jgi:hypothetical protein
MKVRVRASTAGPPLVLMDLMTWYIIVQKRFPPFLNLPFMVYTYDIFARE